MDLPLFEQMLAGLNADKVQVLADRDKIPTATATDSRDRLGREIDDERRNLTSVHQCPHCDEALAIRQNKIVVGEHPTVLQARIDDMQKDWDVADAVLNKLAETIKPLNAKLRQLEQDIKDQESRVSICRRESKATGTVQTEADRAALAQAEQAVEDTREVVKLVQAEADATRLHQTIIRYTEIARALGPEGVRSKMLADGMRKLNGGLVVIASASGWPLTTVGEGTCAVFVGDRPVALCSESEKWRCQAAIQMTLGAITGSKAVVLDRGDILDACNRAGLVAAVNRVASKTNIAVLLCSTGTPQADAPWQQVSIENGVTV